VVEEKPAAEVIVISEEHSTTEAPEFIEETVTSPEAVQYQVPEVEELPAFEVSPAELARLKIDIDKYKRILELNPTNPLAWDKIGGLYKASGLYDEAIAAYRKAISIDSSKSVYFYHLGLVYAAERKLEDAIFAFQKVIEIEPNYSLAHATLGGYYRRMGQEELAKVHIDKALSSIGEDENEYNRACMEAICGNTDRAFELLEIALKNKQTNVEWVRRDPDLDFVRSDPRFNNLLLEYATRPTP
jgi:tetratricopeptide (TPR) repeat protein